MGSSSPTLLHVIVRSGIGGTVCCQRKAVGNSMNYMPSQFLGHCTGGIPWKLAWKHGCRDLHFSAATP